MLFTYNINMSLAPGHEELICTTNSADAIRDNVLKIIEEKHPCIIRCKIEGATLGTYISIYRAPDKKYKHRIEYDAADYRYNSMYLPEIDELMRDILR